MTTKGLFIGMTTVDMQYLVDVFPQENLKSNAQGFQMATGGPATNAAAAFAILGGRSSLCAAIGEHAFTPFMRQDLAGYGIHIVDLSPESRQLPPFSSIITTKSSGERSVVAYMGSNTAAVISPLPGIAAGDFDIVLLDGFQMPVGQSIAIEAREKGIPVVLDGGSWKKGLESLLTVVDIAICSADFRPPGCDAGSGPREVLDYLTASGVAFAAITRGEKPVLYYDGDQYGEIPVEQVKVVDTLGAGDIFHGAFCFYFAEQKDFAAALDKAARVAAKSCAFFGARAWGETTINN